MANRHIIHIDRPIEQADLDYLDGRADLIGHDDATLGDAPAAVIGIDDLWDADRFARFPNLRVVSRAGIGYDNVDCGAASAAGVVVCNGPDSPTVSTAEHTVALMLALTKELPSKTKRALEGLAGPGTATSLELDGATLGLVGMGRIARRVAVVGQALGMQVIACDPFLDVSPVLGVRLALLDEVIAQAHVLSLHVPSTPETRHLVNDGSLAAMRPGAYLINCARGPLIDHDALLRALDAGQLAGAGLDVTDPEPLPVGHPLLGRDDVIVTPHIASSTAVGRRRLYEHAFENALAVLDGRPASVVNPA
ncbi:MAG: NAD(P)-dependent oxidoreductase [Acidimicrobiales bacterium]|jgi:D-3-phosphoglycerate dehydrogenase